MRPLNRPISLLRQQRLNRALSRAHSTVVIAILVHLTLDADVARRLLSARDEIKNVFRSLERITARRHRRRTLLLRLLVAPPEADVESLDEALHPLRLRRLGECVRVEVLRLGADAGSRLAGLSIRVGVDVKRLLVATV